MKNISIDTWWVRIILIVIVTTTLFFEGDLRTGDISTKSIIFQFLKDLFRVAFYAESIRVIFLYMRNRYPDLKDTTKRIGLQILVFFIFIVLAGFLMASANTLFPSYGDETFSKEYLGLVKKSGVLLGFLTIIYECRHFFGLYETTLYESERLKKERLISQFELLKNQTSPHFLFNSLNLLITVIPEDPKLSVEYVQKLSNVYRHVLNYNENNIVYLATELALLEDYIFLYKIRFGEKLHIEYNLPNKIDHIQIIPLTLQMLVENAIKHNIISKRSPLIINISCIDNFIIVKNNLQKRTSGVESNNIGLQNIINRYKLLINKDVEVISTATHFSVSLPLILEKY